MVLVWALSFAGPGVMPVRLTVCVPAPSRMVRLVNTSMVGGSLAEVIVTTKEVFAEAVPSLTEIVIVAVPKRFVIGVTVTLRLLLLPENTILVTGMRLVFEDEAVTAKAFAGVSKSPIVNAIGPAGWSSGVIWSEMEEMVGRPLTANTALTSLARRVALAVN